MDLTEMLDLLASDLKVTLGTEISPVEGTRAIQRAVDELSRHVPRERIYEHAWVKSITDDTFTTPATANATSIVNAMDISASVGGAAATLASRWLDIPRPIKMTLTDANDSITKLAITIKGIGSDGTYREERFYRHNGKIQTGHVYFLAVYGVDVNEISGNGAGDTLSVGIDSPNLATGGVWIQLDNPVDFQTDAIYSGAGKTGTKYTRDTDYEMDYVNGRIRMVNGGLLAVSTTYYANYDRVGTAINISNILPELLRIVKVLYPAGKVPEQSVAFAIWGNMLTIGSQRQGASQTSLNDGDHLAIYYESKHIPPTSYGPGTYPEFLDDVVLVGAGGYTLLMEALRYERQSATDLTTMRTELGKVTTLVTPATGKIALALAKVALYLETAGTTDNAVDVLSNVTDDGARAAVITAVDAVTAQLGAVAALVATAEATITVGYATVNKLNDGGPEVPGGYAENAKTTLQVAQTRAQTALAYAQEASIRLDNIRSYVDEAGGWNRIAETFIGEAQTLVAEVNAILTEASRYQEAAGADLILADRFRAEAQSRLNEFKEILGNRAEYRKRVVSVPVRQPA